MFTELEATSYHEAGHAVASIEGRRRFKHVTIRPGDDSLGHVLYVGFHESFRPDINLTPRVRAMIERNILISMAGPAAEARYQGEPNWDGASQDVQTANELASYLWGGGAVVQSYINFMQARAEAMVASSLVWCKIEAVAAALIEHGQLSYAEARRACREAIARRAIP